MSDMLEQAIIDAAALKEAATKNAETLVLEKYSSQIKDAVETLLEQDDPAAGGGWLLRARARSDRLRKERQARRYRVLHVRPPCRLVETVAHGDRTATGGAVLPGLGRIARPAHGRA